MKEREKNVQERMNEWDGGELKLVPKWEDGIELLQLKLVKGERKKEQGRKDAAVDDEIEG